MARYIDLDKAEFLKVEGNKEFNHGVDCCINSLLEIEPVDVVERAEYDKVVANNRSHAKIIVNQERKLKDLHSKIDKAFEKIKHDMIAHSGTGEKVIQAYSDGLKKALEYLKNIGE